MIFLIAYPHAELEYIVTTIRSKESLLSLLSITFISRRKLTLPFVSSDFPLPLIEREKEQSRQERKEEVRMEEKNKK